MLTAKGRKPTPWLSGITMGDVVVPSSPFLYIRKVINDNCQLCICVLILSIMKLINSV